MKRLSIWLLIAVFTLSMAFMGIGCKKAEEAVVPAEEGVAEEVAEEVEPAEEEVAEEEQLEIGGELKFLGWEGYDALIEADQWLKENSVTIASTYIGNNEEAFTKLMTAGPGAYDVVTPYIGVTPAWIENDLLEPLDVSKLPNFEDLFSQFKEVDAASKDGKIYAVSFTWAPAAMLYNADVIEEPPASWWDLLEPEYKGKLVLIDGNDSIFTVCGLMLGYNDPDPHHITKEQLEEVKELAKRFVDQVLTIAPSYGEMKSILVSGDAIITGASWAAVAGWAQEEGVNIQVHIPTEGSLSYIDAYAIAKGSQNMDTAYAFINEMLSPQVQADLAANLTQAVVNSKAVSLLPEKARWINYDNLSETLGRAPCYTPVPDESEEFATYADWVEAWSEVKAGM